MPSNTKVKPKKRSTAKIDSINRKSKNAAGVELKRVPKTNTPSYKFEDSQRLKNGPAYIDPKTGQLKRFPKQRKI